MIANMNVFFDKAAYEKGSKLKVEQKNDIGLSEPVEDGAIVENAIRESIKSEKLGSLAVDPSFLHFKALECN